MGRRWAARVADLRPDPALLDVGHGLTVLLLRPGSIVVADGDGTAPLSPVELAAARPDPFCRFETSWLAHLEDEHPEVSQALARHLPPSLRDGRARPLGRLREHIRAGCRIVRAGRIGGLRAQDRLDQAQRLGQPIDTNAARIKRDAQLAQILLNAWPPGP